MMRTLNWLPSTLDMLESNLRNGTQSINSDDVVSLIEDLKTLRDQLEISNQAINGHIKRAVAQEIEINHLRDTLQTVRCGICENEGWVKTGVEHYGQQEMYACECERGQKESYITQLESDMDKWETAYHKLHDKLKIATES